MDLPRQQVGLLHVNTGVGASISIRWRRCTKAQPGLGLLPHDQDLTKRDSATRSTSCSDPTRTTRPCLSRQLQLPHEYKAQTAYFNIRVPLSRHGPSRQIQGGGPVDRRGEYGALAGLSWHFKLLRFSPDELVRRVTKIRRDFYATSSAIRRLPMPYKQAHFASWNLHFLEGRSSATSTR